MLKKKQLWNQPWWLLIIVGFDVNCWKKVLSNINNAFLSKLYCFAKNFSIFVWFFFAKRKALCFNSKKDDEEPIQFSLGEKLNILLMLLTKTYLLSKFWKIHAFQSFCLQKRLTTVFNKISPNDTSLSGNFWGSCLVVNFFLLPHVQNNRFEEESFSNKKPVIKGNDFRKLVTTYPTSFPKSKHCHHWNQTLPPPTNLRKYAVI